jgi:tape measure domain-containing protein
MSQPRVGAELILDTKTAQQQIKALNKQKVQVDLQAKNLTKVKSDITKLDSQLKELNNRKITLESDAQSFQRIKSQIEEIDRALANIRNQKTQIRYSDILSDDVKSTWVSQLTKQSSLLQGQKAVLTQDKRELQDVYNEYKKISKQIDALNKKKLDLQADFGDADKIQKELDELTRKSAQLESDRIDLELRLEDYQQVMSQLNNIASVAQRIQKFGNSMSKIGSSMTNLASNFSNNPLGGLGHFLVQSVGYSALYRMTSGFMNAIETSFSGAINRMDTIANSRRTFEAMKFDTSVVDSSLDDLENRILGLPTTLNDAMQSVTMISSITSDLPKAVRIFDALNNSVIAFGGSQEQANRAITQFSQAMGTGKLDARTYLSLTDAGMSPALAQVAEMLGYSSENMGAFKTALGEGEISIEQFTDALIELNENGNATMRALNELAKENALKSIGSSLTVAQTQIEKGWASIIQSINDTVESLGYGSIPENIAKFGNFMRDSMYGVSNFINENREPIGEFLDFIIDKFNAVQNELSKFDFGDFTDGLKDFKPVLEGVVDLVKEVYDAFKGFASFVGGGDISRGLGRLAGGYITLAYGLRVLGGVLSFGGGTISKVAQLAEWFGSKGKFANFTKKGSSLFSIFQNSNKNKSITDSLGKATTTFDKGAFYTKLGNQAQLALMAGNMMLYVEAINQLNNKIPDDLSKLIPKLAILGATMGAMIGVTKIMSNMSKTVDFKTQLTGIVSLIGAGGALYVLAEAIGEVNKKVPDDIGNFASKMANMAIAIGGIGIVVGALGGLASLGNGLGGAIMVLGGIFTLGLAGILYTVSQSISAMADSVMDIGTALEKFGNIEIDSKGVSKNMKTVTDALDDLTGWSGGFFGAIGKLATQKIDEGNIAQASSNLNQLLDVVKALEGIQEVGTLDGDSIEKNLKAVKEILQALQSVMPLPSVNTGTNNTDNLTNVSEQINAISTLVSALNNFSSQGIPQFDEKTLTTTIDKIKAVVTKLKEIKFPDVQAGASLTGENAQNLVSVLDGLVQIVPKINEVIKTVSETPVDSDAFKNALTSIADLLGSINNDLMPNGQTRIGYNLKKFIDADTVQNVVDALNNLSTLVNSASSFMQNYADKAVDWETLKENINTIMESLNGTIDGEGSVEINTEKLGTLSSAIGTFETITNKLETIGGKQVNFDNIDAMISRIQTIISSLSTLTSVKSAKTLTEQVNTLITTFQTLLTTLEGFDEQFLTVGTSWGNNLFQGFSDADVSGQCVEYVEGMIATLTAIDMTPVGTDYGNEVVNGFRTAVASLPSAMSTAISGLNAYASRFSSAGANLGNSFASAFNDAVSNLETPNINVEHDSRGGEVPTGYFSKGGFARRGTDTIPAMLTPGEFVVRRNAVKGIGVSFLKKINDMDFKGAFKGLMSSQGNNSMQASYNHIVNNTSNYNYGDRSITINGGNERKQRLKANRFMKGLAY